MTDFLADLERELHVAHARRHAARRRATLQAAARRAPLAVLLVALIAAGIAFVALVPGDRDRAQRAATFATPTRPPAASAGPASERVLSASDPALQPGAVAVLNATGQAGRGADAATALGVLQPIAAVGRDPRPALARTVVRYAPGHAAQARLIAQPLHVPTGTLDAATRNLARAADVVVEVGIDLRAAITVALQRGPAGATAGPATVSVLAIGAVRLVSVTGAGLPAGHRYAVWAVTADAQPHFVGFIPPVGADGRLRGTGTPPTGVRRVLVTREPTDQPGTAPGPIVLSAVVQ